MPSLASAEALRFVLRQIDGETIPPPPDHGAIEMLGWLELPLDDAPALVVTGLQRRQRAGLAQFGSVPAEPASPRAGHRRQRPPLRPRCLRPFGPGGIEGASPPDRRAAKRGRRSLASQPAAVRLRRSDDGQAGDGVLLRRTATRPAARSRGQAAARAGTVAAGGAPAEAVGRADHFDAGHGIQGLPGLPLPLLPAARPEAGGPGRLGRRTGRRNVRLAGPRGAQHALGKDPDVAAGKADDIAKYLDAQLDAAVLAHFGKTPLPSILVQVEQLRRRLAALARWQADWAAQAGGSSTSRSARRRARLPSSSTVSRCSSAAASTASTCRSRPANA